jgi:ribonucleotide reductase class II
MEFPKNAPSAAPVFYRTYSRRKEDGTRETWSDACDRTLEGTREIGEVSSEVIHKLNQLQRDFHLLPSGRFLWIGNTPWSKEQKNFNGSYNCTTTNVVDWESFGLMMSLCMQGCGTGAMLENRYISKLPVIRNRQNVTILGQPGDVPADERVEETRVFVNGNSVLIIVGDSREGWVSSYQKILELSSDESFEQDELFVTVDLGNIRGNGEYIKGFGGVANPVKLPGVYLRCADVLNGAVGRKLNSVECCLLIDEASVAVVAGNVRRSAGMRQFDADDELAKTAKDNLWQQDEDGAWKIDPNRDALRMANHTRVYHHPPTLQEIRDAVTKQYYSGEGAIQYAPEAIARCNADILNTPELKEEFLQVYDSLGRDEAAIWMEDSFGIAPDEVEDRLSRYSLNPCVSGDSRVTILINDCVFTSIRVDDAVEFWNQNDREGTIKILSKNLKSGQLEFRPILNALLTKPKAEVLEITYDENRPPLVCTPDHKVYTTNRGWVEAGELREDDTLDIL